MYNVSMPEKETDNFTPFNELCKFADEYGYIIEIDKPFKEFENLILKVTEVDGEVIHKVTLDNIFSLNENSADILNSLSRKIK